MPSSFRILILIVVIIWSCYGKINYDSRFDYIYMYTVELVYNKPWLNEEPD